ncbi:hypothetical protein CXB51_025003 [Gossypium anomalum]|uniref:Sugar phosphate transporter domain-containing protein n=1 Tax=Gossypium anomalum TaxID=47600 RepID=A0A8J5YPD8_9ROSI|nr:hypothetical protein CXB51_025003 [Gossypium anomalum]
MVAVGIIFMNKWVLKNVGFQFPVFLTFIHYAVSCALMAILNSFALFPASPPSKSTPLALFTLGVVISLSTSLANVSLKYNSVGFYQMAKIAVTPSIVLAKFIWYKKKVTFSKAIIVVHQVDRNMLVLKLEGQDYEKENLTKGIEVSWGYLYINKRSTEFLGIEVAVSNCISFYVLQHQYQCPSS